jgi:hypothetical protein
MQRATHLAAGALPVQCLGVLTGIRIDFNKRVAALQALVQVGYLSELIPHHRLRTGSVGAGHVGRQRLRTPEALRRIRYRVENTCTPSRAQVWPNH